MGLIASTLLSALFFRLCLIAQNRCVGTSWPLILLLLVGFSTVASLSFDGDSVPFSLKSFIIIETETYLEYLGICSYGEPLSSG